MKFQKTLLAAALSIVSFSALSADDVKANLAKYLINGVEYAVVEEITQNNIISAGQWFLVTTKSDGKTQELTPTDTQQLTSGQLAISKGQITFDYASSVERDVIPGSKTEVNETKDNVGQNNYWYTGNTTTVVTDKVTETFTGKLQLEGKLVNPDENGNSTDYEGLPTMSFILEPVVLEPVGGETTITQVKKDIQIGNLTQVNGANTSDLATYDFTLEANQAQGTLATIKTAADGNTSVAAVTGNGLAVLDVAQGGVVDLEKGTVTFSDKTDSTTRKGIDTTAYTIDAETTVVKVDNEYYVFKKGDTSNVLTKYTGDTAALADKFADAKGLTEEFSAKTETTSVNTGLVSNKNVTYGESVTKTSTSGGLKLSITTPNQALDISGGEYYEEENQVTSTTTSKNVVTGIISEDASGNKTYGLEATTIVNNEVTGKTTVTAEGITTTGVISAKDYKIDGVSLVDSINTRVTTAVTGATQVIDAKILEVDQRLTQFNTTATQLNNRVSQLNKRIDEVEEVANRGVAIALAATQQIPQIGAGQTAVFGGVGHYEGESAVSLGLATVFADGRTSLSAAVGVAGGSEVGGRVGLAYVFGGK